MTDDFDQEVDAIGSILKSLQGLSPEARDSVLGYVLKRLGLSTQQFSEDPLGDKPLKDSLEGETPPGDQKVVHIKVLKEKKKPKSANEMACIVAYYFANVIKKDDRKSSISTSDLETYFKIADFPFPNKIQMTLTNAKSAGYFDTTGTAGEYRLNAVGHNLVVHSLPRGGTSASTPRRARRKAATKKAKTKKKSTNRKSVAKKPARKR